MYRETPHIPSHQWAPGTVEAAPQRATNFKPKKLRDALNPDGDRSVYRGYSRGRHGDYERAQ